LHKEQILNNILIIKGDDENIAITRTRVGNLDPDKLK